MGVQNSISCHLYLKKEDKNLGSHTFGSVFTLLNGQSLARVNETRLINELALSSIYTGY